MSTRSALWCIWWNQRHRNGDVVHRPVPGIDAELEREEAADDLRPQRQRVGREQPVRAEPAVPHQGRVGRRREIEQGEGDPLQPPQADLGKGAGAGDQVDAGEGGEQPERDIMVQTRA